MEKLIFIVDDEQAISKLLSYWAKDKWKYQVETFSNAKMLKKSWQKTGSDSSGYYASGSGWY